MSTPGPSPAGSPPLPPAPSPAAAATPAQQLPPLKPRHWSPPTEPRASRLARVAEEVVAALEARKRAMLQGGGRHPAALADDMLRGSMRVLDDIIQESAATNASYNAGRWAGRGNR